MSDHSDSGGDDVTAMVSSGVSGASGPAFDRGDERLQQGDHVDRYVILSELGAGGMGVVYRAYDPKLCREVALKCLRSNALDRAAEARLVREAQVMAKLSHPNVVAVYDVEVGPHGLVLAMEYVSGGTVKTWMSEKRTWREVIALFIDAGRGLAAAHEQSIIHRDFKPANVLVSDDGRVKVTDFGLAKGVFGSGGSSSGVHSVDPSSAEQRSFESESFEMPLTRADTVMGTPRYMAPEQHAGRQADIRSDQYSFCIALWEALVGRPPYGSRGSALGKDKIGGPPPWPKSIDVPRTIVRAIEQGLSSAPSRRWASMEELLEALSYDPDRRRRSWSIGAGAGALGLAVVGGGYLWSTQRAGICAGGSDTVAEVWNPARAEATRNRFESSGERGTAIWTAVAARLDDQASAWAAKHREVCEATRLRGEQSEAALQRRMECLDREHRQLEAAVDVLEGASPRVVDHAVAIVETIDAPGACDDLETLGEEPATASVQDDDLDRNVRRLRVLVAAGEVESATALRDDVAPRVTAVDSPLLTARYHLALGGLSESTEALDDAQAHYDRALTLALEHGPPRIALAAATALIRVVGRLPERAREAQWLGRVARGMARRLDAGGPAEAAVLVEQARVSARDSEFETAVSLLRSALEMTRGGPVGTYGQEQVTVQLAVVWARRGDRARSRRQLEDSRVLFETRWGTGHPAFGRGLVEIAAAMRTGGKPQVALPLLEEAQGIFERAQGYSIEAAHVWLELARARAESGEFDDAAFETAVEQLTEAVGATHPTTLDAISQRAAGLRQAGKDGAAALLYVKLLASVEARYTKTHPRYVRTLLQLAATRRAQGEPDESIELLRRARDRLADMQAPTELQLRIALSLTELHTGRDRDEAERYLEEARALADEATDAELLARLAASEEELKP